MSDRMLSSLVIHQGTVLGITMITTSPTSVSCEGFAGWGFAVLMITTSDRRGQSSVVGKSDVGPNEAGDRENVFNG